MKTLKLIIALVIMANVNLYSQVKPTITKINLPQQEKDAIDEHISKYKVISFDKEEILDNLKRRKQCNINLSVDDKCDWEFKLYLNEKRND